MTSFDIIYTFNRKLTAVEWHPCDSTAWVHGGGPPWPREVHWTGSFTEEKVVEVQGMGCGSVCSGGSSF